MNTATLPFVARRAHSAPIMAGAALGSGCLLLGIVNPAGGPTICPFKAWTGLDCPGCGVTRAAHQLLNGNLVAALDLNVLSVLILPFFAWGAFVALTRWFGGPSWPFMRLSRNWVIVALVVMVAFGVVRNLPVEPLSWLGTGT